MEFKFAKNSTHELWSCKKKSHTNHTCKHNLTKHLTILPLCTQQAGPKG